ncbi:hypothetical protein SLS62_002522 [Diatrype stigma]|uniref:Centromere protein H C-terminal domain-containing protein n=1 Tax=Diatrype stigma TaxID=117547 RepID=A0AAN9UYS7_9PEZI
MQAPPLSSRDASAAAMARQTASLRDVLNALAEVEGQALRASRANAAQAGEVLRLAAERHQDLAAAAASGDLDAGLAGEMAALEAQVRASRRKWRVVKRAASAIVAGSGVDWARDAELREIVLDEAEEESDGDVLVA